MDTTSNAGGRRPTARMLGWGAAAVLFLLPLVAQPFMPGMNWTTYDYLLLGGLLVGAGALIELAVWALRTPLYRLVAVGVILALALLIAADGAVGVF